MAGNTKQWATVTKMARESVGKVKQTRVILSTVNSNAVAVCLGFSTNMINDFVHKKAMLYFPKRVPVEAR